MGYDEKMLTQGLETPSLSNQTPTEKLAGAKHARPSVAHNATTDAADQGSRKDSLATPQNDKSAIESMFAHSDKAVAASKAASATQPESQTDSSATPQNQATATARSIQPATATASATARTGSWDPRARANRASNQASSSTKPAAKLGQTSSSTKPAAKLNRARRFAKFGRTATAAALAIVTTLGGATAAFAQSNVSILNDSVQLSNSANSNNNSSTPDIYNDSVQLNGSGAGSGANANANAGATTNNTSGAASGGQQINVQERLVAPDTNPTISGTMSLLNSGEVFESDGLIYRFLHTNNGQPTTSVALVGISQATQGLDAIEIPATVTDNGTTYTVVAIGEEAAKAAVAELDGIAQDSFALGTGAGIDATTPTDGAIGSQIEQITIPSTIKYIDVDSLAGFDSLKTIEVDPANETYTSHDGILYTHDRTQLIAAPVAKDTAASIPAETTSIFAPGICYATSIPGFAVEAAAGNTTGANAANATGATGSADITAVSFVTDGENLYRVIANGETNGTEAAAAATRNTRNITYTAAVAWRAAAAGNATVIPQTVALGDRRIAVTAIDAGAYVASASRPTGKTASNSANNTNTTNATNTQLSSIIVVAQIAEIAKPDFVEINAQQV